jgi:hypothetical protein
MTTERYIKAAHAVQAAIGFNPNKRALEPKHMRTGIDMTKADIGGLVTLLIEKGVFTSEEYVAAIEASAEREAAMHKQDVAREMGIDPDKLNIV